MTIDTAAPQLTDLMAQHAAALAKRRKAQQDQLAAEKELKEISARIAAHDRVNVEADAKGAGR